MTAYTVDGYVSALEFRSSWTVLVEGPWDRRAICRAKGELERSARIPVRSVLVDSADMIRSEGRAIGNRAIVELVFSLASTASLPLAALVDREFRDFDCEPPYQDRIAGHYTAGDVIVWTRGHSIENYFLCAETAAEFLRLNFPDEIDFRCLDTIEAQLPRLLRWIAALSICLERLHLLTRAQRIAHVGQWCFAEGLIEPNFDVVAADLLERGVPKLVADSLHDEVTGAFNAFGAAGAGVDRWICHGHLGFDWFWAGVARCCAAYTDGVTLNEISHGFSELKFKVAAGVWARDLTQGAAESPEALWSWIARAPEAVAA